MQAAATNNRDYIWLYAFTTGSCNTKLTLVSVITTFRQNSRLGERCHGRVKCATT